MSSAPKLTTYVFNVWSGNPDEPELHTVHGLGRDVQMAEQLFADRGWGATTARPMTSAAVVCYFAMMRLGLFAGTWADFEKWYLSIEPEQPVTVNPTDAGAVPA